MPAKVKLSKVIKSCPLHGGTPTDQFNTVVEENQRKNFGVELVKETIADLKDDDILWGYDADRILTITILANVPAADKVKAQQALNKRFGINKVKV